MKKVSDKEKAEAREHFENQLRFAFARYEHHPDDDEESSEVKFVHLNLEINQLGW